MVDGLVGGVQGYFLHSQVSERYKRPLISLQMELWSLGREEEIGATRLPDG